MPPPRGLVQQLDQELHKSGLLPRRAKLLLAVSGGADSVALLCLLHAINRSDYWRWTLLVAHIDHGIRGKASAADARFVRKLAASLNLAVITRTLKLGKHASEDTARTARFRALASIAKARKCHAALLAHHADDQAETVLMRLFRGCGIDGLAGMSPETTINGLHVIRPLLALRSADLRRYLQQYHQPWREDKTNATSAYLRNRLRAKLLPEIDRLAPGAIAAITRTAALARQARHLIEKDLDALLASAVILKKPRRLHLSRNHLRDADPLLCSEALRHAIAHVGGSTETADFQRISEAVRLIRSSAGGKHLQLGRGVHMHLACSAVTISRRAHL